MASCTIVGTADPAAGLHSLSASVLVLGGSICLLLGTRVHGNCAVPVQLLARTAGRQRHSSLLLALETAVRCLARTCWRVNRLCTRPAGIQHSAVCTLCQTALWLCRMSCTGLVISCTCVTGFVERVGVGWFVCGRGCQFVPSAWAGSRSRACKTLCLVRYCAACKWQCAEECFNLSQLQQGPTCCCCWQETGKRCSDRHSP